jgi:Ulp1 protease family, C-terminal catalytic domain
MVQKDKDKDKDKINNEHVNNEDCLNVKSSEIKPQNEKDYRCAPSKIFEDGSCIPLYLLVEMAQAYNEMNKDNLIKICSTVEVLNPKKYKRYLVKQFKKRLDKLCDNQTCWIKQPFMEKLKKRMKEELEKDTFRPEGPEGKFTWLNTNNIDQVMSQYEKKYDNYKFLGAVPIDFDDLPMYGIKNLDFKELMDKGKTKIGVIFNLDKHDESGSHWVAMFSDLSKGTVHFFDSYGIEPANQITKLMRRIAKFVKDNLKKYPVVDYNRIRHQFKGSECGVYSISFILRSLRGDDFQTICQNIIKDDKINECRDYYFT